MLSSPCRQEEIRAFDSRTSLARSYQRSPEAAGVCISTTTENPVKKNSVGRNRASRPLSAETLKDLVRRSYCCRPPSMVDGLRQPSIRGRLIPSASRAQPISHSSRAALHISQTCLRCRQSNANTALILELKPPSFAGTTEPELLPPRAPSLSSTTTPAPAPVRGLLNHYGK